MRHLYIVIIYGLISFVMTGQTIDSVLVKSGNASFTHLNDIECKNIEDVNKSQDVRQRKQYTEFNYCWSYNDSATIEELEKLAKCGDSKAMYDLGERMIFNSCSDDRKYRKGLQWIKRAAQNKCPKAMYYLIRYTGTEINKDFRMNLANEILNHPNNVYEPDVLYATAQIYRTGIPYFSSEYWFIDESRYIDCLKLAADLGLPKAQYELSQLLCWGGIPFEKNGCWYIDSYPINIDINKSYEYFKKAGGDDEEYNLWALRAVMGGVEPSGIFKVFEDVNKSLDMFEVLYVNGFIPAGVSLAVSTYGTDYNRSFRVLSSLAENHTEFIETESLPGVLYRYLSACYRFGRGCEIDLEKADYYLRKSSQFEDYKDQQILLDIIKDEQE